MSNAERQSLIELCKIQIESLKFFVNRHHNDKLALQALEIHRLALSALTAEPVAWQWFYCNEWHTTNDRERAEEVAECMDVEFAPLYTTLPAASRVPDGWQLVPIAPTPKMLDAATYQCGLEWEDHVTSWSTMIAAAPSPISAEGGENV